jgi:hypothetical protein
MALSVVSSLGGCCIPPPPGWLNRNHFIIWTSIRRTPTVQFHGFSERECVETVESDPKIDVCPVR